MKKTYLIPCALLLTMWIFASGNSSAVAARSETWQSGLQAAATLASSENWDAARTALNQSYENWHSCQTWLHIVLPHSVIDSAEVMYLRAAAYAGAEEPSEFQAEISGLISHFKNIADMEQFHIRNIL